MSGSSARRVAYVNPSSGAGDAGDEPLVEVLRARGFDIDDSMPDDFEAAIRGRIDAGATVICAVGGDGTHRSAAPAVAGTDAVYVPAPGGTFNHFPKDVGIPDAGALADALDDGRSLQVPIATLNGEAFLNTAVIGWYPEMVRTREELRRRMPRPFAALLAFARHVPRLHRFHVDVDGRSGAAWLIWAGNGRYGTGPTDLSDREDVTDPRLDVRVAWAAGRLPRTRLVWDLVRRRLTRTDALERIVTDTPLRVAVRARHVYAALDAEVVQITPPLTFTPAALTVNVLTARPPSHEGADDDRPAGATGGG